MNRKPFNNEEKIKRTLRKRPVAIESLEDDTIDDTTEEEISQKSPTIPKRPKLELHNSVRMVLDSPILSSPVEPKGETVSDSWVDKYHPKHSSELCINPLKLNQVKDALNEMLSPDPSTKLLILTGPAGSSKSTTIKVLASEMIGKRTSLSLSVGDPFLEYVDQLGTTTTQFSNFLQDCKFRIGTNLSFILIEELPNVFHLETLNNFRDAIKDWIFCGENLPPLILCLTEIEYASENTYNSYNIENNLCVDTLLGKGISMLPQVKQIKFNGIAHRFMKKTVNTIIRNERTVFKGLSGVDRFVEELIKIGDVRSVLFNLQWWVTNKKNSISNNPATKMIPPCDLPIDVEKIFHSNTRETQLNLFHAIGKIIHSSTEFDHMKSEENDFYSVEKVLQLFTHTNFGLLNLAILENYTLYHDSNYDLQTASEIVDGLSVNDLLIRSEESREIGIKQARIKLRSVGGSRGSSKLNYRVKFPRHFKMIREFNSTQLKIRNYQRYIDHRNSFQNLNLIEGYYLPIIYNRRYRKHYSYNRLGGSFQVIFADDLLPVEEETEKVGPVDQFQVDIVEKIKGEAEIEEDSEGEMSDPIQETDVESEEEDWSDEELDLLISQGRV